MSVWAIADLHLSFGTDKPMDIFHGWEGYTDKVKENWLSKVKENDTVIIPGDFSWGIDFEHALPDFRFIDNLPGRKIILKGNHDYWWGTRSKIESFFKKENIKTIEILHNNSYCVEDIAICGTRGWVFMPNEQHDLKISAREALRLSMSIEDSLQYNCKETYVFLHYPPVYANEMVPNIIDVLKKYNIKKVFYGHLHGASKSMANEGDYMGIDFKLVSADHLGFDLFKIK